MKSRSDQQLDLFEQEQVAEVIMFPLWGMVGEIRAAAIELLALPVRADRDKAWKRIAMSLVDMLATIFRRWQMVIVVRLEERPKGPWLEHDDKARMLPRRRMRALRSVDDDWLASDTDLDELERRIERRTERLAPRDD